MTASGSGIRRVVDLSRALKGERANIDRMVGIVSRRIMFSIIRDCDMNSPVDTGRFRGNWQADINNSPIAELDRVDPGGTTTVKANGAAISRAGDYDALFLSNNLPYAQRLNAGHSKQAPAGFVERAIDRSLHGLPLRST